MKTVFLVGTALVLSLSFTSSCMAQIQTLSTGVPTGASCNGFFFNVATFGNATLCDFDVSLDPGVTTTIELWGVTAGGSAFPVASTPAAWTLIAQRTVTSAGANAVTPLQLGLSLSLPTGSVQGFYLRSLSGPFLRTAGGSSVGGPHLLTGVISLAEGTNDCTSTGFLPTLLPRRFIGNIHWTSGLTTNCGVARPWQTNAEKATLAIDGIVDPGPSGPISVTAGGNGSGILAVISTQIGMPWDIVLTAPEAGVPLSGGGLLTAGGQVINIDITAPSLAGLLGFDFNIPYPAAFGIPLSVVTLGTQVAAQSVHLDPGSADGFALSHLNEYSVVPCAPQEGFEGLAASVNQPGAYPPGWSTPQGRARWTPLSGMTPSAGTGPLVGAVEGQVYLYCEASGGPFLFTLDTCSFDATTSPLTAVSFRLSRLGGSIGTLTVRVDDGSGSFATILATYTGPEPSGADWTQESLPLPITPTNGFVRLRFEYQSTSTFGDLAIDDLRVS